MMQSAASGGWGRAAPWRPRAGSPLDSRRAAPGVRGRHLLRAAHLALATNPCTRHPLPPASSYANAPSAVVSAANSGLRRRQRGRPGHAHGVHARTAHTARAVTSANRGKGKPASPADEPPTPAERRPAMAWAQRLNRIININIETCRECGDVRVIVCVKDAAPVVQTEQQCRLHRRQGRLTPAVP